MMNHRSLPWEATFHLPEINVETSTREFNGVSLPVACLTPKDLQQIAHYLRTKACTALQSLTEREIIARLAMVSSLWLARDSPYMQAACNILPKITGYSRPVIEHHLRHIMAQVSADHLHKILATSRTRLSGSAVSPTPARLVVQYCAGNIPGQGVESIIFALLARAPLLLKSSSHEPILGALFAQSLATADSILGQSIAVAWWQGGQYELDSTACDEAEVMVATGDDATIARLKELTPPPVRFVCHPHKFSVGIVGKTFLTRETADAIARDVALFDQQGCLSPQIVFIEASASEAARKFAGFVHAAIEKIGASLPPRELSMGEMAHVRQVSAGMQMRGALVQTTRGTPFRTVILDEHQESAATPPLIYNGVTIRPRRSIAEIVQCISIFSGKLQCIGLGLDEEVEGEVRPVAEALGVGRVCRLGEMQTPPLGWHADGVDPIACLLMA